jgi:hypothetical protein
VQRSSLCSAAALPAGTALGGVTKLVSRMAGPASSVTTSAMPTEHEIKLSTADSGQMLLMALEGKCVPPFENISVQIVRNARRSPKMVAYRSSGGLPNGLKFGRSAWTTRI